MKHEISAGGIVFKLNTKRYELGDVKWLICQHSQHKGWVFPKGLVGDTKDNEEHEDAALREVEEEGGVVATIVEKLPNWVEYFYRFKGQLIKKTVYYFLMEYVSGDPNDHDEEMLEAKFVTADEVRKTLSYKTDKEAFEDAIKLFEKLEVGNSGSFDPPAGGLRMTF